MNLENKYIKIALTLVVLVIFNQCIIQYFLFQKRSDSLIINLAGRQRMLSQRTNLLAHQLHQDFDTNKKEKLQKVFEEWKEGHKRLMYDQEDKSAIEIKELELRSKIENNFKKILEIENIIKNIDDLSGDKLEVINKIIENFLIEMDSLVYELQKKSERKLDFIISIEIILAIMTLVIVYLEFKTIVIPILKKNKKDDLVLRETNNLLEESKNRLKAIIDSTTDGNILISLEYKILSFNKKANYNSLNLLGKPLQENGDMWDYVLPNDRSDFYTDTQKVLKGEQLKFEREIYFEQFSIWFEVAYFPVYNTQGEIFGFTFNATNIETRKKANLQILRQNETLRDIAWQQSHELRRPVANILGLCDLLKNYKNETEEIKNQFIDYLLQSTRELDSIINKIVLKTKDIKDTDEG